MNAPQSLAVPAEPGAPFAGGIYAGRFFVGLAAYALVVAPKDSEIPVTIWNKSLKRVDGALSVYDGALNTDAMAEAGSALAKKIASLEVGGFKDWYLPSRGELLLCYAAGIQGDEAFERDWYWSSTQDADAGWAWGQNFYGGTQTTITKDYQFRARAVRRVPL